MSSIDSGGTASWHAALSQAAGKADEAKVRQLLDERGPHGDQVKETLRIALQKIAGRGHESLCRLLLGAGAEVNDVPDSEVPPLWRAADLGRDKVVEVLLEYGASTGSLDKSGRTAIFAAATKGHWNTLTVLLRGGADPDVRDVNYQNLMLCLASDKSEKRLDKIEVHLQDIEEKLKDFRERLDKKEKQSDRKRKLEKERREQLSNKKEIEARIKVIRTLLETKIDLEAKDKDERTALLWAAALGKDYLVELLLSCRSCDNANVNATNNRGKTALHLAAENNHPKVVTLLLAHNAKPHARSDGGWTALHNAADKGHCEIASLLLDAKSDINAITSTGMTALHWAARNGHAAMVRLLLLRHGVRKNAKDLFDSTPMLGAAENGHIEIVQMLSPADDGQVLSNNASGACRGFQATVVDFGMENRPLHHSKYSVFDVLYGMDESKRQPLVTTLVRNVPAKPTFRWIHLPANNMTWVDTLITKHFVENNASDVEGFKALERSFGQCHKGPRVHSHFMRPLCQRIPPTSKDPVASDMTESATETLVDEASSIATSKVESASILQPGFKKSTPDSMSRRREKKSSSKSSTGSPNGVASKRTNVSRTNSIASYSNQPEQNWKTPLKMPFRKPDRKGNIVLFMPYLHYETDERRRNMSNAIRQVETASTDRSAISIPSSSDEMLVQAYLRSTHNLHIRRTLDQFYYHAIETDERDIDQVVYRYTRDKRKELKIFMVDQLWVWILSNELIISSFPQRWQQPRNDPLNVLDGVIEDIGSKTQPPVRSVYDLAMLITGRCCGVFDRHRLGDEDFQFLDMFESSIGEVTNKETKLFKIFNDASELAAQWLRLKRQQDNTQVPDVPSTDSDKDPAFVDTLLDIGKETALLAETKDIRDELNMISMVLKNQLSVIDDLTNACLQEAKGSHNQQRQAEIRKRLREQQKLVEVHLKDVERMDKQAEGIYTSLTHLLDLKQKHANAFEARFARDQAVFAGRQGQTIMVFTIVTAVFLPMSFIAAVFAIPIREFPHNDSGNPILDLAYVLKFMIGIGLAISVPLIAVAFAVDNIGSLIKSSFRKLTTRRSKAFDGIQAPLMPQASNHLDDGNTEKLEPGRSSEASRRARPSYESFGGGLSPIKSIRYRTSRGCEEQTERRSTSARRDLERADGVGAP